jgi:4-amino-4-deoxy-L-arabinose transferase-like glycosyltransferase
MMTSMGREGLEPRSLPGGRRGRALALALLGLLIVFHVANNWLWRAANEVIFGADRMYHLVSSLSYWDLLKEGVNLSSLFAALTLSGYYPPLVHLTVTASYALFGVSADGAAMTNSLYLVLYLLAVYGIGERLAGPWIGLAAAALVSLFPIVFSMSRYLYIDFALAAMVALNVCLLLRSEGFSRRGPSLLYGLSFGLGMLVKWTFVAFALPPLLAALATPGLLSSVPPRLRLVLGNRRRLLASALLGLAVTALWFLPNMQATARLPLGYALPVLSWLSWTLTFTFLLASRHGSANPATDPPAGLGATNLLAALSLAVAVAAAWYLTRIDFARDFWANAYGKPTGRAWGFLPYLRDLYQEHLSPLYAGLLLLALAGLAAWRWRRTRSWRRFLALGVDGWALVLWVMIPYVVFSAQVSIIHSRYIMPLLPSLALAIALALGRLRPPWLRGLAVGLALLPGLVQFAALSFDALAPLQERLPLAQGLSIQLPATGRTDPGFAVVPDVLQTVDDLRRGDSAALGLLVNMQQVNNQHFAYAVYGRYPHLILKELAAVGSGHGVYGELFDCDFVLVVDPPPHYPRRPEAEATIKVLLTTSDDSFHRAFSLVKIYPLPDGQRLRLYARRFDAAPLAPQSDYEALAAALMPLAAPGDAVAVLPAGGIYALARHGGGSLPLYPLPGAGGAAPDAEGAALLARLGENAARLWLVVDTQASQGAGLQGWLAPRFYRASDTWFGALQLLLYAPPGPGGESVELLPGGAIWQNGITLQGARALEDELPLGQILRLDLTWQATGPTSQPVKVFLHLLDAEGGLRAQRDAEPLDGTRPTTSWQPGETIADRAGLWLPTSLAPGDYRLLLGLYNPGLGPGERVPTRGAEADTLPLALLRVEGSVVRILALPEN